MRAGNLAGKDFAVFQSPLDKMISQTPLVDSNGEPKDQPLLIAQKKYFAINLYSDLLQGRTLVQMLLEGRYDKDAIRKSLNNSRVFLKREDMPPWKTVISFLKLEDDVVDRAVEKMKQQFDKRAATNPGEMLHIFSLRMMMAEHDILSSTIEEEVAGANKYIDDLLEQNRLPARDTDHERWFEHETGYDGYAYWVSETARPHFNDIQTHLREAMETALKNQFPTIADELLNLMNKDPRAFYEQVSSTNNGPNPYALIPVLSHIPAKDFVEAWLGSPKSLI